MSLTSLLKNKSEVKTILKKNCPSKKSFYCNGPYPAFSKKTPMLVPYKFKNNWDAALVGTAADYLFRFNVARVIKVGKENAIENLWALYGLCLFREPAKLKKELQRIYDKGIVKVRHFIYGEELDSREMASFALRLAYLEQYARSLQTPLNARDMVDRNDEILIEDLISLSDVFVDKFINSGIVTENSDVVFNPTFGKWTDLCGGADADIYIDGVLYDFKCSKYIYKDWTEIGQIYGYYCLNRLCEQDGKESSLQGKPINAIALYMARHGTINTCVIKDSDADSDEAMEELRSALERRSHSVEDIEVFIKKALQNITENSIRTTGFVKRNIPLSAFPYKVGTRFYAGPLIGYCTIAELYEKSGEGYVVFETDKGGEKCTERLIDFFNTDWKIIYNSVSLKVGRNILVPGKGYGRVTAIDERPSVTEIHFMAEKDREIVINKDTEDWHVASWAVPKFQTTDEFPYKIGEKAVYCEKEVVTISGFDTTGKAKYIVLKGADDKIQRHCLDSIVIFLSDFHPIS